MAFFLPTGGKCARENKAPSSFLLPGVQARPSLGLFHFEPHEEEAKPMHNKGRVSNVMFDMSLRPQGAALGILLMLLFLLFVFCS